MMTFGRTYTLWQDTDGVREPTAAGRERIAGWQVNSVSLLVQAIHAQVRAVAPRAIISVASVRNVPWNPPVDGQAAWLWLDAGWVDVVFPTLYLDSTADILERVKLLRAAVQDQGKHDLIMPGLATYDFDRPKQGDWSELVAQRVNALTHGDPNDLSLVPTAKGIALFRSEYLSPDTLEALAAGPFQAPAVPYWGGLTDPVE
jgi:uncharacterized lipoprotein YddW (UPF0748 family)